MKNIRRWSFASFILMLLIFVPAFAQDSSAITLAPITDDAYGFTSVAPEGWTNAGPGVLARKQTANDITLLAQQASPLPLDAVLQALVPQLGLQSPPESIGTYEAAAQTWTLYKIDVQAGSLTIAVDLALAETDGKTYVVLLQTTPDEYDALHEAVFIPLLDAMTPLAAEATSEVPYSEAEITFPNGDITLAGTLTIPEGNGPHPAMVLVTGSGPQDRDESLAPVASIKPFRLIADALTREGIAVLRYDDRGVGKSSGDFGAATTADFATDAAAAIDYLLTRDDIDHDQVGLLGHSEGGNVAVMLGANNPHLAFIISMAGPAVSGADILITQNRRIYQAENASEAVLNAQLELLPKLFTLVQASDGEGIHQLIHDAVFEQIQLLPEEQQQQINDPESYAQQQADAAVTTYNTDWWRFLLTYNPGEDWAKTHIPVLAVYGTLDVQVDAEQNAPAFEAAMKSAGNTDYQVVILPKANHLMQEANTGSVSEYGTLKQEFTPDFLPTITDWILEHVDVKAS